MLTKPTPRFVAIQSSYWACYCCIISFSSVYCWTRTSAQVGLVISLGEKALLLGPPAPAPRFAGGGPAAEAESPLLRRGRGHRPWSPARACSAPAGQAPAARAVRQPRYGPAAHASALPGHGLPESGLPAQLRPRPRGGSMALRHLLCGVRALGAVAGGLVRGGGDAGHAGQSCLQRSCPSASRPRPRLHAPGTKARGRPRASFPASSQTKGQAFLRAYPHMGFVLLASCLVFISHNLLNTFAFQIVQHLGGNSGSMGTVLFLQSILELPVMFGFSWLLTKAGSRVLATPFRRGLFPAAPSASWLAPTIGVLCAVQIFEMNGYALFAIASIYYINETVAEDRRVEGQSWFTMATTLGSVLAGLFGGNLLTWPASPPCWACPP
ncbi:MAG: MFS transporter [Evtepia sp.]